MLCGRRFRYQWFREAYTLCFHSSCTQNSVKTLQAPLTCVCQVCTWSFSQATLFRTADLTFTSFKSAALITVTAKCLIKSKARDNDSIRSSFHSTVTASAVGFLHSPLRAVTVPRPYTRHTHPSSWTDIARGLLTCHRWFQAPSSRQRPLLPWQCTWNITYFTCKNSSSIFPDIFFLGYREGSGGR